MGGGGAACQVPVKKQAVKRHHHKHNLKHRYEFLETLGKGTYGKVKKARERSGRLVSKNSKHLFVIHPTVITIYQSRAHVCSLVFALLSGWSTAS